MNNLRESLGWIIGSAVAGTLAIVSWVFESGLFATLLGIMIGAGLTYFVERRSQKRTWKREYAVKTAVEVYGVLYNDLKSIIMVLEEKWYRYEDFRAWREMQDDHRYFMVDKEFRKELDQFKEQLEKQSKTVVNVQTEIIPQVIIDETEKLTGDRPMKNPSFYVSYKSGERNVSSKPQIEDCLVKLEPPIEHATKRGKNVSDEKFHIQYELKNGRVEAFRDPEKLEDYWKSIVENFSENETYRLMVKENKRLLSEAKKLQKEIANRIEEPWKI